MYKYKMSRKAKKEFADKMHEISAFCFEHGIQQSNSGDSYYFRLNGVNYRVSNHTIDSSNSHAYNELGMKTRELYHPYGREENTVYITAGKTRIIEVYNDLLNGYTLNRRGYRV